MAVPFDSDWSNTNLSDAALNGTTHGSGTTAERTAVTSWPVNRPFFDTDLKTWFYNSHISAPSSVTWTVISTGHSYVMKTSDEIVNNSATLQNDDELSVTVTANTLYKFSILIHSDATSTASLKMDLSLPSGTFEWTNHRPTLTFQTVAAQPLTATGNPSDLMFMIDGILDIGGTGGTVNFQWAQNTATVEDTTVKKGSTFELLVEV